MYLKRGCLLLERRFPRPEPFARQRLRKATCSESDLCTLPLLRVVSVPDNGRVHSCRGATRKFLTQTVFPNDPNRRKSCRLAVQEIAADVAAAAAAAAAGNLVVSVSRLGHALTKASARSDDVSPTSCNREARVVSRECVWSLSNSSKSRVF